MWLGDWGRSVAAGCFGVQEVVVVVVPVRAVDAVVGRDMAVVGRDRRSRVGDTRNNGLGDVGRNTGRFGLSSRFDSGEISVCSIRRKRRTIVFKLQR